MEQKGLKLVLTTKNENNFFLNCLIILSANALEFSSYRMHPQEANLSLKAYPSFVFKISR